MVYITNIIRPCLCRQKTDLFKDSLIQRQTDSVVLCIYVICIFLDLMPDEPRTNRKLKLLHMAYRQPESFNLFHRLLVTRLSGALIARVVFPLPPPSGHDFWSRFFGGF